MNRQLKRANEKSDKRREREQAKLKAQRQAKRVRVTEAKDAAKQADPSRGQGDPSAQGGRPERGRLRRFLEDAYLLFAIGVIASQPFLPQRTDTFSLVTHTLFYVILGYFLCLWFLRRGVAQAFPITLAAGLLLAVGVEAAKLLVPQSTPEPLFTYLALPGLLLGAWLGRFIFRKRA